MDHRARSHGQAARSTWALAHRAGHQSVRLRCDGGPLAGNTPDPGRGRRWIAGLVAPSLRRRSPRSCGGSPFRSGHRGHGQDHRDPRHLPGSLVVGGGADAVAGHRLVPGPGARPGPARAWSHGPGARSPALCCPRVSSGCRSCSRHRHVGRGHSRRRFVCASPRRRLIGGSRAPGTDDCPCPRPQDDRPRPVDRPRDAVRHRLRSVHRAPARRLRRRRVGQAGVRLRLGAHGGACQRPRRGHGGGYARPWVSPRAAFGRSPRGELRPPYGLRAGRVDATGPPDS